MALNAAQLALRAGRLGGSDITTLMNGDPAKIIRLWREKIGEELPEDLSGIWAVRLGEATEPLNLAWYEQQYQQHVIRRGEVIEHWQLPWAICTLDGWIEEDQCPIEAKHVGGHEPSEVIIERYQPQCQWQCEVTGADECVLSVIMGARAPVIERVRRDAEYCRGLIKVGTTFMEHVKNKTPPVDLPTVPPPPDVWAIYDMAGDNEWAANASRWLELRDSADAYDEAAKVLKSLVPADAKKCFGYGIQITRNRAGNLSLREFSGE